MTFRMRPIWRHRAAPAWLRLLRGAGACGIAVGLGASARPCELHHRRPQLERRREAVLARIEHKEVEAERLVGLLPDRGSALANLIGGQLVAAEGAEAASARDRGDEGG